MGGRVAALDGIRAVAVLSVVFFHISNGAGTAEGVDLFFVLSGFLITTLLLDEGDREGRFSLRGFYRRRVRRIAPPLVITLVAYFVLNAAVLHWGIGAQPLGTSLASVGFGAAFVANEAVAYNREAPGLIHLWSLAMEEQFYALWPLVLLVLVVRKARAHIIARGLLAIVAAICLLQISQMFLGGPSVPVWVTPLFHAAPILVGCATALLMRRVHSFPDRLRYLTALALPLVMTFVFLGHPVTTSRWSVVAIPAFWFVSAFLIGSVWLTRGLAASRVLSTRPLVEIGKVSFGIYLYSSLLIRTVWFWIPVPWECALIATALAFASYHLVERRFLRSRTRRPQARLEPAPVAA